MYIVPIGFFIIFLITTAMGLLFIFKLKKKSKYNIANGTIALGTGIFSLIACIIFLFFLANNKSFCFLNLRSRGWLSK